MSFWKSLERNVFRPVGRAGKAVAPVALGIAGSSVLGPLGGALGASLGGALKRGKFDLKNALVDGGSSLLFNGIASKLGGIPGLGGGAKAGVPDLAPMKNMIGMTAGSGLKEGLSGAVANTASNGIGDAVKGAVAEGGKKWLTGKNIAAVGDAAIGGMQAYSGMQQNKLQQQMYEDNKRREEEDREREQAMDPMRSALLQQIMMRLQGNTMPQVR